MEIWSKSQHIESTNRLIASQPQSRAQTVEIPYRKTASLAPVDYGEILITVLKGNGIIKSRDEENRIEEGDQVHLLEGDEFVLLAASQDTPFFVQLYWAPNILDLLT